MTAAEHRMKAPRESRAVMAKLRVIREAQGITQADITRRMGLARTGFISMLETGHHDPRLSTVIRYMRALGLRLTAEEIRDDNH